jgi:hypothetical protein
MTLLPADIIKLEKNAVVRIMEKLGDIDLIFILMITNSRDN